MLWVFKICLSSFSVAISIYTSNWKSPGRIYWNRFDNNFNLFLSFRINEKFYSFVLTKNFTHSEDLAAFNTIVKK